MVIDYSDVNSCFFYVPFCCIVLSFNLSFPMMITSQQIWMSMKNNLVPCLSDLVRRTSLLACLRNWELNNLWCLVMLDWDLECKW